MKSEGAEGGGVGSSFPLALLPFLQRSQAPWYLRPLQVKFPLPGPPYCSYQLSLAWSPLTALQSSAPNPFLKEAFSCTPEDTKFSSHLITAPKLLHCAEHTDAAMCMELHAFFPSRL